MNKDVRHRYIEGGKLMIWSIRLEQEYLVIGQIYLNKKRAKMMVINKYSEMLLAAAYEVIFINKN